MRAGCAPPLGRTLRPGAGLNRASPTGPVRGFDQVATKVESEPLKRGYYRDETFYLRDRDTLGAKVTFRQFR